MSMCEKEEIQCPVCGTTGEFEMWKSVNTVLNPEKKEQLLSGALLCRSSRRNSGRIDFLSTA